MSDRDNITLPREVVEEALQALIEARALLYDGRKQDKAATVLRTAIAAEPQKQEPVAWGVRWKNTDGVVNATTDPQLAHEWRRNQVMEVLPLYTAPPEDEALRRDAERYRWLRENTRVWPSDKAVWAGNQIGAAAIWIKQSVDWTDDASIDAAIDAEMGDKT